MNRGKIKPWKPQTSMSNQKASPKTPRKKGELKGAKTTAYNRRTALKAAAALAAAYDSYDGIDTTNHLEYIHDCFQVRQYDIIDVGGH